MIYIGLDGENASYGNKNKSHKAHCFPFYWREQQFSKWFHIARGWNVRVRFENKKEKEEFEG